MTKDWYKSRTLWLGIGSAMAGLLMSVGVTPDKFADVMLVVVGVIGSVLRFDTDTPLGKG